MRNRPYPLYSVDAIEDLRELIDNAAKKYGDNPAFSHTAKNEIIHISYNQFKSDVEALGTAILNLGIRNSKIAVIGENSYYWILSYFAVVNTGNIIVPIDKEMSESEINWLILDSQANVLIFSDEYKDIANNVLSDGLQYKWNMKGDLNNLADNGRQFIASGNQAYTDFSLDNKSLCSIIYTSGTTGTAKGVMLSHRNLSLNAVAASKNFLSIEINMLVLPLHHTFAFTAGVLAMIIQGSQIAINRSLKNVTNDLLRFKPYDMFVVPLFVETFYKKIWDTAKKSNKDKLLKILIKISNLFLNCGIDIRRTLFKSVLDAFGGNLNFIVCGGAPLDVKYVLGLRDFGINVLNGYGITECSPVVAVNRNNYYRDCSVGLVLPDCQVKISNADETGNGEILVKSDFVMLGYYNNERATQDVFVDGWFNTGDIGWIDKDGFLFINGRTKNLIIGRNGKNVYPEELETYVLSIEYVKEVMVFCENDNIVAELYLDIEKYPGCAKRLDMDILELNRRLPNFKKIARTIIRDKEFSKTSTKKIKRQSKN